MKKLFSLFGFASLLLLSFAFTPAENVCEETTDVCSEVISEVCVENIMMFGNGDFKSCAATAQIPPPNTIIYRLSNNTGGYQDFVECDTDNITLPPGVYDLYVRSTAVQAWVYCKWSFCGGASVGNASGNVGPGPVPLLIGQVVIPC